MAFTPKNTPQHPLYQTYHNIKQRCGNKNNTAYMHYGGRGIKVCKRWLGKDGFSNFLEDMGNRPQGRTLDRINPDGDYEPGNCRWATWSVQMTNKGIRKDNKLGYIGVQKAGYKYRARLRVGGKSLHLGVFDTPEEACSVYKQARAERIAGGLA